MAGAQGWVASGEVELEDGNNAASVASDAEPAPPNPSQVSSKPVNISCSEFITKSKFSAVIY